MLKTSRPIYASDTTAWERCRRLAWFLFHPPGDEPLEVDRFQELIQTLGDEHEADVLASFEQAIEATSVEHTRQLMTALVPVIYQPKFHDSKRNVSGTPDFLLLTEFGYQIADAKLALSVDKNRAVLAQLGVYQYLLGANENRDAGDTEPIWPIVFLGDGEAYEVETELATLASEFLDDMQALRTLPEIPETHFAYSKCSACGFYEYCLDMFERADDLTLSPAIDSRTATQLKQQNFLNLSQLSQAVAGDINEAPYLRNPDKRRRIVQQAQSLKTAQPLVRMPPEWPSATFVHFDVESDPMAAGGGGEVYLWGFLKPPHDEQCFEAIWRDTDDFATWQDFLSLMRQYQSRWPNLRLVHYSPYERVMIQHYAERYQAFDDEIVAWLLSEQGPLWDLQAFLKRYFVLPVRSYGLKAICTDSGLVDFQWRLQESGSQWSMVRYHDYVAALAAGRVSHAESIKQEIMLYNEDDVRATVALVTWLQTLN